ncbi:MAG: PRC-barrel domain-containing protein [Parvibaculum sp.]|uniref:PRC-barrel domain-containing protein n=1 Tax=Parvibaculum sp. TaxID=2024848 RepID=UPI002ABBF20A|nr:PRC-barrel domain-containing protein [Parvibaculum sp.]MDZ4380974.1 PRC-barrel domain-containing protein [Parvibaculum sp.]
MERAPRTSRFPVSGHAVNGAARLTERRNLMKRLLTTTVLAASVALASAGYAAPEDAKNAPTEVTPAQQQSRPGMETPDDMPSTALEESSPDVLMTRGNATLPSGTAIAAGRVIGADVVGPDGKNLGVVDDLVFDANGAAKRVIIADGAMFGFGGKMVAIDFDGTSITRDENDDRMVRIGMTAETLENATEFDKSPLEKTGGELASSYLGREVALATEEDGTGEISDLILDRSGAAKYAVIEYGGRLGVGGNRTAVEFGKLTAARAEEPVKLAMTLDELRQKPAFFYSEEEVPEAGEM